MKDLKPSAIIAAATHLMETLEHENAALAKMDIPRATRWVDAKAEALTNVQALIAERSSARADEKEAAERLGQRLYAEVNRNKYLLERAMHVQGRIVGMIARAMPRAMAANASRYGANGGIHTPDLKQPIALSSRA